MKHELKIICLHDARANCKCGWNITCTGERSKEYLTNAFTQHLKQENYYKQTEQTEQTGGF